MKKKKRQTLKLIDGFVTVTVIIAAATLVASGIAIARINTEYMTTGEKAAKIVAERENEDISISLSDEILIKPQHHLPDIGTVMELLPAPINTGYMIYKEIRDSVFEE